MKSLNIICVHHSPDLDGLTSGVLLETYFGHLQRSIPFEYNGMLDNVKIVSFDYYNDESKLFDLVIPNMFNLFMFVDVTASDDFYKKCIADDDIHVILMDHHVQRDLEILELYGVKEANMFENMKENPTEIKNAIGDKLTYFVNGDYCASMIFYQVLVNTYFTDTLLTIMINGGVFGAETKWYEAWKKIINNLDAKSNFIGSHSVLINVFQKQEMWTQQIGEDFADLVTLTNYYDVWLWESVVKSQKKIISGSEEYSLIDMFNDTDQMVNNQIKQAISAYAFNYFAHRFFKLTREFPIAETDILLHTIYDRPIGKFAHDWNLIFDDITILERIDIDEMTPTKIMKDILFKCTNEVIINKFISLGVSYYIKDYAEVVDFFEQNKDNGVYSIYSANGYKWVIVETKFSNVIRDYLANTYKDVDFVIFDTISPTDRTKVKINGRTLKKGSFPIGPMMKEVFNGGGHPDAGGGTMDKSDLGNLANKISKYANNL